MSGPVKAKRDGIPETISLSDSDALRVAEILGGAARRNRDPDLGLMLILAGLRDADDAAVRSALVVMVSDANSD